MNDWLASFFRFPTASDYEFGCVLPMPPPPQPRRAAQKPKETASDMFLIDEATQSYGFRTASAVQQRSGASPELSGLDVEELDLRGIWSDAWTKVAKTSRTNTARAKALWADGKMVAEIATLMGLSESWVEKRAAAFEAALKREGEGAV